MLKYAFIQFRETGIESIQGILIMRAAAVNSKFSSFEMQTRQKLRPDVIHKLNYESLPKSLSNRYKHVAKFLSKSSRSRRESRGRSGRPPCPCLSIKRPDELKKKMTVKISWRFAGSLELKKLASTDRHFM